jgi:hypothetical protein
MTLAQNRRLVMRALALSFAASLLFAGAALAQPTAASLTLADGAKAPASTIIDGAVWKCFQGVCMASGGKSQPADRACRRVASKLGAVTAFTWRGQALSSEALAGCNAAVREEVAAR